MRSATDTAKKPGRGIAKSRLAKPLLTSLGTVTMLAASTFVLLAVASTGSAKPWDWTRADPAAALTRYQFCGHQGLGAIGCMLSSGFRPAAADAAPSGPQRALQPLTSVATVPDQAPADASAPAQGGKSATGGGSAPASRHGSSGSGTGSSAPRHLVNVPAGASESEIVAACQAAMKTAQTQGAAAMTEVADECEADLKPACPAVRMPLTQGTAAIQEMEDECTPAPSSPGASPSPRASASPDE